MNGELLVEHERMAIIANPRAPVVRLRRRCVSGKLRDPGTAMAIGEPNLCGPIDTMKVTNRTAKRLRASLTIAVAASTLSCHSEPTDIYLDRTIHMQSSNPATDAGEAAGANARSNLTLPGLIRDGDAVFFVGNSFMGWHHRPLPEWVAALGRAVEPPIHIEVGSDIVFGNTPLGEFLKRPATRDALASRKYKVFVLQAEEFEPVDHPARFREAVHDFNQAINAAGSRAVLFMTWEFRRRRFMNELALAYDEVGRELGIPVIPVGLIYWDCDQRPYHNAKRFWLTDGELHENEKGMAVNAYATFELLTGTNPLGMNFQATGNTNDSPIMKYFSDMAWSRVALRLRTSK